MTKPLVLFVLLFALGVGNVWADDWEAVWNAWLKCDFNGSAKDFTGSGGYEYQYNPTMTGDAEGILYDLGTLDAGDFVITYLSWKIGDNWNCDNTYSYMWYTINDGSPEHSSGQSQPAQCRQSSVLFQSCVWQTKQPTRDKASSDVLCEHPRQVHGLRR